MDTGDIVLYRDKLWRFSSSNRDFGTCILVNFDTERVEVSSADTSVKVLYSTTGWPFSVIPAKAFKAGRIVEIKRRGVALRPLVDWVPSDMLRAGGSLFFNPDLKLQSGEVLVARHEKGFLARVPITKAFGTGKQRQKRKASPWKPAPPVTVYDRLTGDSPFDDEDDF